MPERAVASQDLRAFASGEGEPLSLGGRTLLTVRAEWTGGAYCLLDQVIAPGFITAPHFHDRESQVSLVVEGRLGFWVDGDELEGGPGSCIFRPAGKPHALWNSTDQPAHMIEITTPAGRFQSCLLQLSAMIDAGTADEAAVREFAAANGTHFVDGVLDDLKRRHGLSERGGFWR
jgi:mannose-6-phosphate isomerase-like protein (cupin superfamily)